MIYYLMHTKVIFTVHAVDVTILQKSFWKIYVYCSRSVCKKSELNKHNGMLIMISWRMIARFCFEPVDIVTRAWAGQYAILSG